MNKPNIAKVLVALSFICIALLGIQTVDSILICASYLDRHTVLNIINQKECGETVLTNAFLITNCILLIIFNPFKEDKKDLEDHLIDSK